MSGFVNPAFAAFLAEIKESLCLAQVLILRMDRGFELRHSADRNVPVTALKKVDLRGLRQVVDFTSAGQFRPLKSAPNLSAGWFLIALTDEELELALNQFYPNGVVDWFVTRTGNPPITPYREFTARQTGMYRITTMLSDQQAGDMIRACCDKRFCLKQRLWTVGDLPSDAVSEKSLIPCLEPCAVLLEFARKAMRIEQEEKVTLPFAPSDLAALKAALECALANPDGAIREGDFASAANGRRLQLVYEKLNSAGITLAKASEGE